MDTNSKGVLFGSSGSASLVVKWPPSKDSLFVQATRHLDCIEAIMGGANGPSIQLRGLFRAFCDNLPSAGDVGMSDMRDGCFKCGGNPRPRLIPVGNWIRCEKCGGSYGEATPGNIAHLAAPVAQASGVLKPNQTEGKPS